MMRIPSQIEGQLQRPAGDIKQIRPVDPSTRDDGPFSNAVNRAVKVVDAEQKNAADVAARFAAGDEESLVRALVTTESANLSLRFALQVRNKVVEAYKEVMRMQI